MENIEESNKSFRIETAIGAVSIDIVEEDAMRYLKITQCKQIAGRELNEQKIFILDSELEDFKKAIDKVISRWEIGKPKTFKEVKEEARKKHSCAYMPWEPEDDNLLLKYYKSGCSIKTLSEMFERSTNSIESRLKKLKLL